MKPSAPRRYNSGPGALDSFFMNPVLVIIAFNIIVFITSYFHDHLVPTFGLAPSLFTQKPWTLLTAMFVHVEIWHLLGNMITLYFFGRVVYKMMGGWRFLLIYFIGGLAGNLLYIWLGPQFSYAIGASGAVYALAGALVVLMPNLKVAIYFVLPMPLWAVVLIFFVLWSFIPGVAWQAHLGGLVVGLIAGFIYRRQMRHVIYR